MYKIGQWKKQPIKTQNKTFQYLIQTAQETEFGKKHNFSTIKNYTDFKKNIPIKSYEDFLPYIEKIKNGEPNILWPKKPIYLCLTSGTTAGKKYIPITKESIKPHILAARNAILCYIQQTKKNNFVNGKMIFIQGSPVLEEKNGIQLGRLSGIVAHHVPYYLQKNRLPKFSTNAIEDFEEKIKKISQETAHENMTVIGGIPPWIQVYFNELIRQTKKKHC